MRLLSFICHPNGIVLRVFKQKQRNYTASGKKRGSLAANDDKRKRRRIGDGAISSTALVEFLNESISDTEMKTETDQQLAGAKQCSAEQRLPSFISHPNGIVLHVLKSHIFLPY